MEEILTFNRFIETFKMNKKVLIVPNYAIADQSVRMANEAGIPCINLECKTIRDLVLDLCRTDAALQDNELRFIGEEVATTLMMDIMSEKRSELDYFIHEEWIDIPTAREIMRQIMDLRLVKAQENLKADADTAKLKDLKILINCYEKRLSEAGLLDYSALLIKAIDLINQEKSLSPIKYGIFANSRAIGLERAFINILVGSEASIIKAPFVAGFDCSVTNYSNDPRAYALENQLSRLYDDEPSRINAPTIDFFKSYGQINEFKYVLQDIIRRGYPFGAVQVIFTDASYSLFLYNTAQTMGINLSLPGGVPGYYSEIYAFLRDLFTFVKNDYFAEAIKPVFFNRILQLGDDSRSNRSLFDHYLSQGIGFGRTRYEKFIQRSDRNRLGPSTHLVDSVAEGVEGEDNGDDAILESFIQSILELFPADLMKPVDVKVFTQQVVLFIERYCTKDNANGDDQRECQQVASALRDFANLSTTKLSATIVMDQILLILECLCVKSTPASDDAILATSLSTAGYVIRPYVYVIGLDAGRFPIKANESPVLLDTERKQLGLNFGLSIQAESGSVYRLLEALSGDFKQLTLGYNYFDTVGIKEKNASSFYVRLLENQGIEKKNIHKSGFIGDPQMILEAKEYYLHATKVNTEQKIVIRTPCNPWNQLKPAEEAIDSLSASSLTTFLECPRKYYFLYQAQLTPPVQIAYDRTIWLDPLAKGTFIHKILEDYVEQGIINDKESGFKEFLFQQIFEKNCKKMVEKVPYLSQATYEMQRRHLLADTRASLNQLCDDIKQDTFMPVATELSFGMRGKEMIELKLLNGETLKLRGAIDRVDVLRDGTYRIVDYKTGKCANIKKKREQGADTLIQDYLYAVVLEDIYKKHSAIVSESRYDFPCDRQKRLVTAITAETKRGLFDQLAIISDKIRTGSFERCKSEPDRYRNWETTCSYCNYVKLCQAEAYAWEEIDGR